MTTPRETSTHRVWHPPQSPVRIEYSDEFLRQVQREGEGEKRGILYGRRGNAELRVLAARRLGSQRDLRLIGLEQVGMFVVRQQGQVFLTEHDLELADRLNVSVILVVTGRCGGFFVHSADGSIQAIRSFQEFPMPPYEGTRRPGMFKQWLSGTTVAASLVGCVALSASPKVPLTVTAREEAGQLIVHWSRGVQGTLEITNNRRILQIPVSASQKQTVFVPDRGNVQVRLLPLDESGPEQSLRVEGRVEGSDIPPDEPLLREIEKLRVEHEQLQAEAHANAIVLARLERGVTRAPRRQ
jgi:hypothetical protein